MQCRDRQGYHADDRASRDPAALGRRTEKLHETANIIYAVVSGTVRATIDGQSDELLTRGDVIVVTPWQGHIVHGVEDAILLQVTDESIMAKFGLLRHA